MVPEVENARKLVVNVVPKSGSVHDSQSNADAILLKLCSTQKSVC